MTTNFKNGRCFVITPIGEEGSPEYKQMVAINQEIIIPILKENGFTDIKTSADIKESGLITSQIMERILHDDLAIVNLSGLNPNVMYELAVRHATSKPIIHICNKNTMLPFDIKDFRTIFFEDSFLGIGPFKQELRKYVEIIDCSITSNDNPIFQSMEIKNFTLFNTSENADIAQTFDEYERVKAWHKYSGMIFKILEEVEDKENLYNIFTKKIELFASQVMFEDNAVKVIFRKTKITPNEAQKVFEDSVGNIHRCTTLF